MVESAEPATGADRAAAMAAQAERAATAAATAAAADWVAVAAVRAATVGRAVQEAASALSSPRLMKAMMSSTTVASRTSWPVHSCTCEEAPFAPVRSAASRTSWPRGVLSTCPMFITLVATPTAVGIAAMATTYAASAERPTAVARPAGRLGEGSGKGPSRGRRGRLRWRGQRRSQRAAQSRGVRRTALAARTRRACRGRPKVERFRKGSEKQGAGKVLLTARRPQGHTRPSPGQGRPGRSS